MLNLFAGIAKGAGLCSILGQLVVDVPICIALNLSSLHRDSKIFNIAANTFFDSRGIPRTEAGLTQLEAHLKKERINTSVRSVCYLYSAYRLYNGEMDPFVGLCSALAIGQTAYDIRATATQRATI